MSQSFCSDSSVGKVIPITSLKSGRIKYKSKNIDATLNLISPSTFGENEIIRATKTPTSHFGEDPVLSVQGQVSSVTESSPASMLKSNLSQYSVRCPPAIEKLFSNGSGHQSEDNENEVAAVIFEKGFSRLFFKVPDIKKTKKVGQPHFHVLECYNISAADLKVTSKFGSWDSLSCRLLIECNKPIVLWSTAAEHIGDGNIKQDKPLDVQQNKETEMQTCVSKQLRCYMVKAVIPLEHVTDIQSMLQSVKLARTQEIQKVKELKKNGKLPKTVETPPKICEGLPEWVNYIPYQWYSSGFRITLEYILVIYTIISLLWAIWQLYKHVDFIRAYLKPVIEFIEYYFFIIKDWFYWLDRVIIAASHYWWSYLKPSLMLIFAALAPLAQVFKPLRRLADTLPIILAPFIQCFLMVYAFIKPIIQSLNVVFQLVSQVLYQLLANIAHGLKTFKSSPAVAVVIERGSEFTIVKVIQGILHGKLDPLKAQFIVVRDLMLQSARKIFFGVRFIMVRIYYMIVFIKRERKYASEGTATDQKDNIAGSFGTDNYGDIVSKAKVD